MASHLLTFASACAQIGEPGKPWGAAERVEWRKLITQDGIKRSYNSEVVEKLKSFKEAFDVLQYGTVLYEAGTQFSYELYAAKSKDWDASKPSVLVTGGVHGYETSGVEGALLFLQTEAQTFTQHFNLLVVPCVSPWGYEHVQRWNADAVDPNRSFQPDQASARAAAAGPEWESIPKAQEADALMALVASMGVSSWKCHVDLHETTNTDETEFRPAKSARDGVTHEVDTIPDGFYLVANAGNPQPEWQAAIIDSVRKVK
jgi:hypothetical protein